MAINRGPWNALVDDDGSNLVGSIWNKAAIASVILDPVDAALPPAPTYGTFTPIDTSGAGLTFAFATGNFARLDRLMFIWFQVVFPATSNGLDAKIGGFPTPSVTPGTSGAQGYGAPGMMWYWAAGTTFVQPKDFVTAAFKTNAQMSGANVIVSATYLTA